MEVDREVVLDSDVAEFARLARPLLAADPVRHTSVSTVLHGVEAGAFDPAAMLTMHENGQIVGALLGTAGQPALVSPSRRGVPPRSSTPCCGRASIPGVRRGRGRRSRASPPRGPPG